MILGLALSLALISDSVAQSPQQTPVNQTPKTDDRPASHQRGTPNQPLTVKVVPTPEQKADAEKETAGAKLNAADDEKLIKYTGDLVLVGIVQFCVFVLQLVAFIIQACYLRRSVVEMRRTTHATIRATRAAQKSADALFAAERARFFIVIDKHDLNYLTGVIETSVTPPLQENAHVPGANFNIRYRFRNYGKTPGIIKEVAIHSMIATDPIDPVFTLAFNDFPENMIGPQDSTPQRRYNPTIAPVVSQLRAIRRNNARFWFFGRLYYDDVFGNHQVHRFYFRSVWLYDDGGKCILQPYDYKHHNQST
ncbi:MAG: hypothetical protein KGK33_14805 [Hyphomicrobiales bacterium]|nr:hypothetical protein [Hyphomicrobiales bacterium]